MGTGTELLRFRTTLQRSGDIHLAMTADIRRHSKFPAIAAAALLCRLPASGFLLTAVGLGIESDEVKINSQAQANAEVPLKRAANIALIGFFVVEAAATWALTTVQSSGFLRRFPAARAGLTFAGLCILSYAVVLLAIQGIAPDPLLSLTEWLTRQARLKRVLFGWQYLHRRFS